MANSSTPNDAGKAAATPSANTGESSKSESLEWRKSKLVNEFMEIFTIGQDKTLDSLRMDVVDQFIWLYRQCLDDKRALQHMIEALRTSREQTAAIYSAYSEDLDEKMEILGFLAMTLFKASPLAQGVTPLTWAALIVAPLEILQEWKEKVHDGKVLDLRAQIINMKIHLPILVDIWKGKIKDPKGIERPARKDRPKQIALQRDSGCCVLLGSQSAEAAHIYPWASALQADDFAVTMRIALADVWGRELVQEVSAEMDVEHVDIPQNIISLNCLIHYWMDRLRVALEPVPEKSTPFRLVLRFRHLMDSTFRPSPRKESPFEAGGVNLNTNPVDVLKPFQERFGMQASFNAVHFLTSEEILDGHEFAVTTEDPENLPLPSIKLLQIAYNMARMITLAGAGEEDEDPTDDPPAGSAGDVVSVSNLQGDENALQSKASAGNVDYESHPAWQQARQGHPAMDLGSGSRDSRQLLPTDEGPTRGPISPSRLPRGQRTGSYSAADMMSRVSLGSPSHMRSVSGASSSAASQG